MKKTKMFGMLLTLVTVLGSGVINVSAQGEETQTYSLENASLTKDFHVADGVDISGFNTFTFKFTPDVSNTASTDDHPTVSDKTVTVGTQSDDHAYGSLTFDNIFDIDDFLHAGEYIYTVNEIEGNNDKITYDDSEYKIHLYVINNESGLEFSGVTVENGDGEKVDPTIKQGENTSGFNFENTYKENIETPEGENGGVLKVTKSVTGNYGDKTKTFPVTVTLTIPTTANESDVILDTDSKGTLDGLVVTADLSDSDSIIFRQLPAGTEFKVEEIQDSLYDGKISGDLITEAVFDTGVNVTASSLNPIVDNSGKNVALVNHRDNLIPTGIIINNMPYMLLVVLAGVGLTFIVVKKRAGI